MDDADVVRLTRNSLRAGKSRSQILRGFQNRGFRLEYADKILQRALRPKKIFVVSLLSLLIIAVFAAILFLQSNHVGDASGLVSAEKITGSVVKENVVEKPVDKVLEDPIVDPSIIDIDSSLLSDMLVSVGVGSLRKNFVTFQPPRINVVIGDQFFHAVVDGGVVTSPGLHDRSDVQFVLSSEVFFSLLSVSDPKVFLRDAIARGDAKLLVLTNKANLVAKGYLKLYDSFQ